MNLTEKLLSVPERENSGARSSNRFNYQQAWAFNHILELVNTKIDFLLFMEFHDDIIVLESKSSIESVDFYQIKTDNKPTRYLTTPFITKDAKKYPKKMSIAQKMIINYTNFSAETKGIHLVSNKNFDFGNLKDGINSTNRNIICLNEVEDDELGKIKKGMCQLCFLHDKDCKNDCVNLIYFKVADMDLVNYEDTILGRFVNFLARKGIESSLSNTRATFHTILGEIRRINNWEASARDIIELKNRKSISKKDIVRWIDMLSTDSELISWDDIRTYLLNDKFTSVEVSKIGVQWKKYKIEDMNDNETLQSIKNEIRKIISTQNFESSKKCVEYVYGQIECRKDVKIFPKEYIYAIIIKEFFYESD